jgi:hypothetical protein
MNLMNLRASMGFMKYNYYNFMQHLNYFNDYASQVKAKLFALIQAMTHNTRDKWALCVLCTSYSYRFYSGMKFASCHKNVIPHSSAKM